LIDRFRSAAAEYGRPLLALLAEAASLRLSPSHLGFSEYMKFKLHLSDLTEKSKRQFVGGQSADALKDIVSDERARFIARDKLTTYTFLHGYGLPTPAIRAVHRSVRPRSVTCIQDPAALVDFLRNPDNLPVYLKPSFWGRRH
jgi:hypothetical protein